MGNMFSTDKETVELKREIIVLKSIIENSNCNKEKTISISTEEISKFVEEEILKNKNVNIKYLPDVIERQIYRNMFQIGMGVFSSVLKTSSI